MAVYNTNRCRTPGAAYLIAIGVRSLQAQKQRSSPSARSSIHPVSRRAAVRTGFLTNLLNPKVTLFFLALFTQIIRPGTPLPAQAVYGLTMVGVEFGWFALVAVLISHRAIKGRFVAVAHWIERTTGVVLIVLGIRVALSEH